jgi:molybdate transport system regulatory protein
MSSLPLSVGSNLWLMAGDQSLAGRGRIELLERIEETGSIRQAALAMGMSYRAAWGAVELMTERSGVPLVIRSTGGRGGGGAKLSDKGKRLIQAFHQLEAQHARHVARMSQRIEKLLSD